MSLRGIVARFRTGTYTVTRQAAGTLTLGRHTPGATSTFPVDAAIFPLAGRSLKALPDGQRAEDTKEMFVETQLNASPTAPDIVTYNGEPWGVQSCQDFQDTDGSVYWRVIISRRKATP